MKLDYFLTPITCPLILELFNKEKEDNKGSEY
jgi:hypothetical protein